MYQLKLELTVTFKRHLLPPEGRLLASLQLPQSGGLHSFLLSFTDIVTDIPLYRLLARQSLRVVVTAIDKVGIASYVM